MILNFTKINFQLNWASGVVIVTLLISTITLYLNNVALESKIDSLDKNISKLSECVQQMSKSVSTLQGSQEMTNKAISLFMENPPSEIKYRIEKIEELVFNKPIPKPTRSFSNRTPH